MWTLGLNRTHDAAITLMKDNDVVLHLQEERLTHEKHCCEVIKLIDIIKKYTTEIDILVYSYLYNKQYDFSVYIKLFEYAGINIKLISNFSDFHHLAHASSAFNNSNFKTAACVIIDGAGSDLDYGKENESIFHAFSPTRIMCVYKSIIGSPKENIQSKTPQYVNKNPKIGAGMVYSAVTTYLGFSNHDCGKTMGLSSYGKDDVRIKPMLLTTGGNSELFELKSTDSKVIKYTNNFAKFKEYDYLFYSKNEKDAFIKKSNLSYKLQKEFEDYVFDLIVKSIDLTGEKNIVLGGGCALNCVANYNIMKRLPPEINLYVDPLCGDDGISMGAAKYQYKIDSQKDVSLKTLYLGQQIEYNYQLNQNESEEVVSPQKVAELISQGNIVSICQGKSEAGPRSLGNRSILFDPRVENGKEIVNKVKKREWWRPFAGTVLLEYAKEWFDMDRLEESPHMMYAVDVWEDRRKLIPNITHVDGTCRIQTLRKEYNPNYYELIEEFYKLTGIPILFNTSFNLAGDTIVETIDDAFKTLRNSEIEYMYLPEIKKLIKVPNK
jgi:carbamoyltransferase